MKRWIPQKSTKTKHNDNNKTIPPTTDNIKVGTIVQLICNKNKFKRAFDSVWYRWDDAMKVILGQTVTVVDIPSVGYFGLPECEKDSGQPIWWYPLSVIETVIPTKPIDNKQIDSFPADKFTILLVSGFIRCFKQKHKSFIIPIDLITVCIQYSRHAACFRVVPNNIQLSNNDLTISKSIKKGTVNLRWNNTSCGNLVIKSANNNYVYKWYVKMIDVPIGMIIGLVSKSPMLTADFTLDKMDEQYAYWTCSGQIEYQSKWKKYGKALLSGDVLCVELNLKQKNIRFYRNGNDLGIAFKNVKTGNKIHYRLAVSICSHGTASIINFEKEQHCNTI